MKPTSFEYTTKVCFELPFHSDMVTWEPNQIQAYISLLEAEVSRAKDALSQRNAPSQRTPTEKFVVQRMSDTGDWVDINWRFCDQEAAQKYVATAMKYIGRSMRIIKRTDEVV